MAYKLSFETAPSEKMVAVFNLSQYVFPIYPCCHRHVSKDAGKMILKVEKHNVLITAPTSEAQPGRNSAGNINPLSAVI